MANDVARCEIDDWESPEQFPQAVALLVFERLLAIPALRGELERCLAYCAKRAGAAAVSWDDVPRASRLDSGWLWLQELGLGHHTGGTFQLDEIVSGIIEDVSTDSRRMTQAELDERLAAQRRRGRLAEEYVVHIERERLRSLGLSRLAEMVVRISDDYANAGYDILSADPDGGRRYIEVKSSAGPRDRFVISTNELSLARRKRGAYWLVWVGWASRLPDGECEVAWFQDPARLIDEPESPWVASPGELSVQHESDDTEWQTPPQRT